MQGAQGSPRAPWVAPRGVKRGAKRYPRSSWWFHLQLLSVSVTSVLAPTPSVPDASFTTTNSSGWTVNGVTETILRAELINISAAASGASLNPQDWTGFSTSGTEMPTDPPLRGYTTENTQLYSTTEGITPHEIAQQYPATTGVTSHVNEQQYPTPMGTAPREKVRRYPAAIDTASLPEERAFSIISPATDAADGIQWENSTAEGNTIADLPDGGHGWFDTTSPEDSPEPAEATAASVQDNELDGISDTMQGDEPWSPGDYAQVVFANKPKPAKDAILLLREKLRRHDLGDLEDLEQGVRVLQALERSSDPMNPSALSPPGALGPLGGHLDDDDHNANATGNGTFHGWPMKLASVVEGDLVLGGLMMVHERHDRITCGPIMPQGGIQALEAMLYTLDRINGDPYILPGIKLGAHILDDCDKDTHGLEMAVDFIKGRQEDGDLVLERLTDGPWTVVSAMCRSV